MSGRCRELIIVFARIHWQAAFWVLAAAILCLALAPASDAMPGTGWDKSNHLIAFALLTVSGLHAYPSRAAAVLSGVLAYGGLIELVQLFTPYRTGEWSDLLVDGIGVLAGWSWSAFRRYQTAKSG
jgi:VanZ family protein